MWTQVNHDSIFLERSRNKTIKLVYDINISKIFVFFLIDSKPIFIMVCVVL